MTAKHPSTLAARLEALFELVREDRGPGQPRKAYTNDEVAAFVRGPDGDLRCTGAYISALRKSDKTNPTFQVLERIAAFFEVPITYFTDDELADRIHTQLGQLRRQLDEGPPAVGVIFRGVGRLDRADLEALAAWVTKRVGEGGGDSASAAS